MTFNLNFNEIFKKHFQSNQKTWKHDRSTTVGASEIFSCIRQIGADKRHKEWGLKQDEDADEESWGAMERGNIIENHFVVPALEKQLPENIKALYIGEGQETLVKEKNSATPDGLFVGLPTDEPWLITVGDFEIEVTDTEAGCFYLEIKSIDPRANLVEERAKHFGQTQVGLHLVRTLTEYKPRFALILYIDASFIDHINGFLVDYDPNIFDAAQGRATKVFTAKSFLELAAEGKLDDSCKYCKWTRECGEATVKQIDQYKNNKSPKEAVDKLHPLIAEAEKAKLAYEQAEKDHKAKREAVKEALKEMKVTNVKGIEWTVNLGYSEGKDSLNTSAMEADGIDVEKYKKKGNPYEILKITPKRKDKETV